MLSILLERKHEEHPLDNVRVGFEFEFSYRVPLEKLYKLGIKEEDLYWADDPDVHSKVAEHFFPKIKKKLEKLLGKTVVFSKWDKETFRITEDISVADIDDEYFYIGYELVTPPFEGKNGEELEAKLRNVLVSFKKFIDSDKNAATTETSGLHVNISTEGFEQDMLTKLYMAMFFDTSHMLDSPEERKFFAKKGLEAFKELVLHGNFKGDFSKFIEAYVKRDRSLLDAFLADIERMFQYDDKKRFDTATSPRGKYVEFRVIGGKNYEDRIDEIMKKIEIFAKIVKRNAMVKEAEKIRKILNRLLSQMTEKVKETNLYDELKRILHSTSDPLLITVAKNSANMDDVFMNLLRLLRELISSKNWRRAKEILRITSNVAKAYPEKYGKYEKFLSDIYRKLQGRKTLVPY